MEARRQRASAGLEKPTGAAPRRLYVEADGTTVPMRASKDSSSEGAAERASEETRRSKRQRTPGKVEYKEVKVGAVFEARRNESGELEAGEITYTGTFGDAGVCVEQVVAEAKARGSDAAEEVVLLSDGGEWLWNRLPAAFAGKKVTQILDGCHPSERLTEISKKVFGEETPQATEWAKGQRGLLYEGDTRPVIQAIEQVLKEHPNAPEYVGQSLGYFKEHEHRMNYGELRAQGYFIGSGVIESACGHVVGDRLKGSGMKWSPGHVPYVLALRVGRASDWWDKFWKEDRRN